MDQQPQRLRPQGSRDPDCGGTTLDRSAAGRRSRTKVSLTPASSEAAYKRGVRLLTARDRTCVELARLLANRGFTRSDIQTALNRLKEDGYLNDRRFARAWARGRLQIKPMGRHRLSRELEARGIEEQLAHEILEELYDEGEESMARRAMTGKLSALRRLSASSRTLPVARFLHRRGFAAELIWRLLHEEQQG